VQGVATWIIRHDTSLNVDPDNPVYVVIDLQHFKARTANRKIKIYFDNFAANQRDELIAFLHGTFAPEIQQGWSVFAESRVPSDPRRPQKSRAAAAVCALLLFAIGGILGYCWLVGLGVKWLVLGIVNALAGLWYVWRIWKFRVQPTTEETA